MRKTFPLVILALLATTPAFGFQSDWIKVEPAAANFSVLMPAQPKEEISKKDAVGTGPYTTVIYLAKDADQLYMLGWVDYETFVFNNQRELELSRDNFLKAVKATLESSNNVTLKTFPGLEFKAHNAIHKFVARIYIVGKRPTMLIVGHPINVDASPGIDKFFSSFNVRPPGSKGL